MRRLLPDISIIALLFLRLLHPLLLHPLLLHPPLPTLRSGPRSRP